MFTGIIEEIGSIAAIEPKPEGVSLVIAAKQILEGTRIGDSVAVDGVCLTVTSISPETFSADLLDETRRKTNLNQAKVGTEVNLERSLTPLTRIGGHFVLGHVDKAARLLKKYRKGADTVMEIELSPELKPFVAPQGSIAINGISLTVVDVSAASFTVYLIPHTLKATTFKKAAAGELFNIEVDVLARYIYNFSGAAKTSDSRITESFLKEKGFI